MSEKRKLAVLGGSSIASPLLVEEMAKRTDRTEFEICLIGRTRDKLEKVAAAGAELAKAAEVPLDGHF